MLEKINSVIKSGAAYDKFLRMLSSHGVKLNLKQITEMNKPKYVESIIADKTGYIHSMNTFKIGMNLIEIGAGRKSISDSLDYTAGITVYNKLGDKVIKGDEIGIIYNSLSKESLQKNINNFAKCFDILNKNPDNNIPNLILN